MKKKYNRDFLKQVLVKIDFKNTLANYEKGLNPEVAKNISAVFPVLVEFKNKQQTFVIDKTGVIPQQSTDQTLWTYYSGDKQKHARIEPTDFYIQYDKYESFPQLKDDFQLVFGSITKEYGNLNIIRLGLRYIDEIRIEKEDDVFDWKKYLNSNLFSSLSIMTKKDRKFISRAFSNLELNYGDHNIIFKYGMFNPDYPSPIKKKVFIIDIDAYKRDSIPENEVLLVLDELHKCISNLFEYRLIKEGLREIMNE
jgi:uncharacterized protein (TIGR04255 family)